MKKLIVTTLALILTSSLFAQDNIFDTINKKSKHQFKLNQISEIKQEDRLQYQVDYTRHCLNQFRKEKQLGYILMAGGAAVFVLTNLDSFNGIDASYKKYQNELRYSDDLESRTLALRAHEARVYDIQPLKDGGMYASIAISLTGTVLQVISYRWMKRAYIGPNGMGVVFKF